MSKLPFLFDPHAYEFTTALEIWREAYSAAEQRFAREITNRQAFRERVARQEVAVPAVEDWEPDLDQIAEYEIDGLEQGLRVHREATLVWLHHFWEKSVLKWIGKGHVVKVMGKNQYVFKCAYEWLRKAGLSPDDQKLESLRTTVNLIKHGGEEGRYESLVLTSADVETYFEVVRRSGFHVVTRVTAEE